MKRMFRVVLAVGIVIPLILLSGCLFNVFQTARTIGEGNLGLLVGSGLLIPGAQIVTPQARLVFGVSDSVDFGMQTGGMFSFDGEVADWLGASADLKISLFDNPESLALSLGLGAAYNNGLVGPDPQLDGSGYWSAFASLYLDSNVPFLPLYASYRPSVILRSPQSGESIQILNQFTVGIAFPVSDKFRLLIELDMQAVTFNSFGIGFEATI